KGAVTYSWSPLWPGALRPGTGFAGVVRRVVATHPPSRRVMPTARTRFNVGFICREPLQPAKLREQPRDDAREENPVERPRAADRDDWRREVSDLPQVEEDGADQGHHPHWQVGAR